MGLPLYVPVLYIGFLFGPLYVFSKYYMGKKQRKLDGFWPWLVDSSAVALVRERESTKADVHWKQSAPTQI